MAAYHTFTTTTPIQADPIALLADIRVACGDAGAGASVMQWPTVIVKKATIWTAPEIAATQSAIDTCPSLTPQRQAQNEIDQWPLSLKAFALALVDQINVLRTQAGLSTVTPAQALAAIRQKAATL